MTAAFDDCAAAVSIRHMCDAHWDSPVSGLGSLNVTSRINLADK